MKRILGVYLALAALASITGALLPLGPSSNTLPLGSNCLTIFNISTGDIGQFNVVNPPPDLYTAPNQLIQNCSSTVPADIAASPNPSGWFCVSLASWVVQRRSHVLSSTVAILQPWKPGTTYSAMFDDGNGTTFDISMPSNLCPHAVIGDLESPQGDIIENATLSKIHDTLFALSSTDQTTYLSRLLDNAIDAIQAEFDALVCDEPVGGSRALLWSLNPRQLKNWSAWITGTPLTFGIFFGAFAWSNGWGPFHVRYGWAARDSILASAAVLQVGLVILWTKLSADGRFEDFDA